MATTGKGFKPIPTELVTATDRAAWDSQCHTHGLLEYWVRLLFCRRKKTAPYPGQKEHAGLNLCFVLQMDLAPPVWLRVRGTSMLPWRMPGSEMKVEPIEHDLQPGTVIVFRRGAKLYYHRVIEQLNQSQWRTKGDTLVEPDEPVSIDDIIGHVTAVRRNGRMRSLQIDYNAARVSSRIGQCFARFYHPTKPTQHIIRLLYLAVLLLVWPFRGLAGQKGS